MPKHIVLVSKYYWPEQIGSAPYVTQLAEFFATQGCRVTVIAAMPSYPDPSDFSSWYRTRRSGECRAGVNILRLRTDSAGRGSNLRRVKGDILFAWTAFRLIRGDASLREAAAILYLVPTVLGVASGIGQFRNGSTRQIAMVHDIESGLLGATVRSAAARVVARLARFLEYQLLRRRCVKIVALTNAMALELESIARLPKGSVDIVPIWVDRLPFVPRATGQPFTVIYSGNLGRKQNVYQLIPLFLAINELDSSIRVVIQGGGSERLDLERAVTVAGAINVEFRPVADRGEFLRSLAAADVHLIPQASEVASFSIPSKVYSAMSVGRPWFAICDGSSPLIELASVSAGGRCFDPDSVRELAVAIVEISRNRSIAEQMGRRGWDYVGRELDKDSILRRYLELCALT